MAGVYCATDASRGIWEAPANVVLSGISDVTERLNDDEQGAMNQQGINAIRYFNHRGFVVWGARTLKNDDNWRYIPVRRLFNSAERDIKQTMQSVVFEPNNAITWMKFKGQTYNWLRQLWLNGGLRGTQEDQAFKVLLGVGESMSEADIRAGKMIIRISLAVLIPAEFIELNLTFDTRTGTPAKLNRGNI
ncbi:phage tail sheath family protein [Photorhabdus sp. SF281]|uniref:phage tail sheath family protein n=1 Tax=Photorhabdus sp. SF281 TaxID=3459527 RepID=UPI004044DA36